MLAKAIEVQDTGMSIRMRMRSVDNVECRLQSCVSVPSGIAGCPFHEE